MVCLCAPSGPSATGASWEWRSPSWTQVATGQLTRTPFVLMDVEGNTQSHIWMHPHEPRDVLALLTEDGTGGSYSSQPFLDDALPTDIDHGVLAVERRAWTGDGEAIVTVTGIGLTGDTLFTSRVSYTPTPLPAARVDSVVRATAERMHPSMSRRKPGLTIRELEEDIRNAIYAPAYLPAVAELTVARNGNIWLRRFDPVESETGEQMNEWWILDPAGSPMARAHAPAGHRTIPPREGRVGRPTPRCTLPLQGRYVRGMWTDPARPANIAACHECGQGAPGSCPDLAARPAGDDS